MIQLLPCLEMMLCLSFPLGSGFWASRPCQLRSGIPRDLLNFFLITLYSFRMQFILAKTDTYLGHTEVLVKFN